MSSQSESNKALVLEYIAAFGTFDTEKYFPFLAENPTYMAGMNIRQGRQAFQANTDAGRVLYPKPDEAVNENLAVIADGDWVAVLLKRRAGGRRRGRALARPPLSLRDRLARRRCHLGHREGAAQLRLPPQPVVLRARRPADAAAYHVDVSRETCADGCGETGWSTAGPGPSLSPDEEERRGRLAELLRLLAELPDDETAVFEDGSSWSATSYNNDNHPTWWLPGCPSNSRPPVQVLFQVAKPVAPAPDVQHLARVQ